MADSGEAGPSKKKSKPEKQAKEEKKNENSGFHEIKRREIGCSHPRNFSRRIGGSEVRAYKENDSLRETPHQRAEGFIHTISFNTDGDILISGYDDKEIIFWDWSMRRKMFSYDSGHPENVFQAKIMPFTDNRTDVSSSAHGQVRVGQIKEGGDVSTKQIGSHVGRVHRLAIEPGSPNVFYSCGEDGIVQHFDLRTPEPTKLFTCSPIFTYHHGYVPLTTIALDPRNPNFFSIGGYDQFAHVYDIRFYTKPNPLTERPVNTFCPTHLIKPSKKKHVRITGLSYSSTSELLLSYNDELIYNFQKESGLGPDPLRVEPVVYEGHRNGGTIKGVSYFGMRDEYVVSCSDCGHFYIWRKKEGELLCMVNGDKIVVTFVESHPYFPFLASSGIDKNIKVWTPSNSRNIPSLPKHTKQVMKVNKIGRKRGVGPWDHYIQEE